VGTGFTDDAPLGGIRHSRYQALAAARRVCFVRNESAEVAEAGEEVAVKAEPLLVDFLARGNAKIRDDPYGGGRGGPAVHVQRRLVRLVYPPPEPFVDVVDFLPNYGIRVVPSRVGQVGHHVLH